MNLNVNVLDFVQFGGSILTVDRTIFEMWLGLGGSPGFATTQLWQDGMGGGKCRPCLCRCNQPESGIDLLFRDCLEEIDLESGPCL